MKSETTEHLPDAVLALALKKSALIMHALAFKLDDQSTRAETLALVAAISDAAYRLEELSNAKD